MKRTGGGLALLEAKLKKTKSQNAAVGWFPSAKYEDGTPVAGVMKAHIYGFGVPMRDPLRPPMRKKQKFLARVMMTELARGGAISPYRAVTEQAVGIVKKGFKDLKNPPLADSTIRARRAKRKVKAKSRTISKPLIDTGLAVNSVDYEII